MAHSLFRKNQSSKTQSRIRRCRLSLELLESRVVPSIFTVTNTNDSGPGSLRQAILNVNADTLTDTIAFNIGNGGVQTIQPHSALPTITNHVVIDGTTQPGYAGTPLIVLNGISAGVNANGLTLSGGSSTVQGLVVNDFQAAGILLSIHGNDLVQGNFLGTDPTGTTAHGNLYGVRVDRGSDQNVIGGNFSADRNVASGNRGYGIEILGLNNLIVGNFIGTDVTGTHAVPNGQESTGGMFIGGDNTTIGGIVHGSANLISGNNGIGILVNVSGGHLIEGNLIGTDVTGTRPLGNSSDGIYLGSIPNTTVGGTLSGAGNLISGNGMDGVGVAGFNDLVQGNRIGTDVTGRLSLGNGQNGVNVSGTGMTIGGTMPGSGNVISGNVADGVTLSNFGQRELVQGNLIGTDVTGSLSLGNHGYGVSVFSAGDMIGGTILGAGNVISANFLAGIHIAGYLAVSNLIEGNFVGTDIRGMVPLGNQRGVLIDNLASANRIGGTDFGARNIISGNIDAGVLLGGTANLVQGNFIGTDIRGIVALRNGGSGISISARNNTIGGTAPGSRNIISGNAMFGVVSSQGTGNLIEGNFIGTDVTGTTALSNGNGVFLNGNATLGGTPLGAGNLVSGNPGVGVQLAGSANVVQGNRIGTDVTGTHALPNAQYGVNVTAGANNVIGGTLAGAGNLISGNTLAGVEIDSGDGTIVAGNLIGTDQTGAMAVPNGYGMLIRGASHTTVGGATAGARNIVSGNNYAAVYFLNNTMASVIEGNYIGTNASGLEPVPNGDRIRLDGASGTTIGGTAAGAGNLISGNLGDGIYIISCTGDVVQGNNIGTDITGSHALGNFDGVWLQGGSGNTLGGTTAPAQNLISGNFFYGVVILASIGDLVQGNEIGTDITGSYAVGNSSTGVLLQGGSGITLGGTVVGARNLISGNTGYGVFSLVDTGDVIAGNYIGTDITGSHSVANTSDGLDIRGGTNNTVGGIVMGARNLISGNLENGIYLAGSAATNLVVGNYIGTNFAGSAALQNGDNGVEIESGAHDNTIGGAERAAQNVISGNGGEGVRILQMNNPFLQNTHHKFILGNFIGTNAAGTAALGNHNSGIFVPFSQDNVISGNLVSGNLGLAGIAVCAHSPCGGLTSTSGDASGNVIIGNKIGTDVNGTAAIANAGYGISIDGVSGTGIVVGGTTPDAPNIISGNIDAGVSFVNNASNTLVEGNYIGTDASGTLAVPNGTGIAIRGSANNTIGGTSAASRNVISANMADGILLVGSGATHNLILGNFIGTDATGEMPLGNGGDGVRIDTLASHNTVGGSATGAANVISGHIGLNAYAINIDGGAANNLVQGNLIGTDATGSMPLGNFRGIHIGNASNNTIGGTVPGSGNVISANMGSGILLDGAGGTGTLIQGNYIGTDITSTVALGNGNDGVHLFAAVSDTTIGGTLAGAGNVISGNLGNGIRLERGATQTAVLGNLIGTDATATLLLGNAADGVVFLNDPVFGAPHDNTIGGTAPGAGNVIAFNGIDGVLADTGTDNAILHNRIFGHNNGLGIELINGGNNNQPFPTIISAAFDGQFTTIAGTLASAPNTTYTIELFINSAPNPSGYGEGERFFASLTVATDADGHASFDLSLPIEVDPGQFVSATATDPDGNTSQFALCVEVTGPGAPVPSFVPPIDGPGRVMSPRSALLPSIAVPNDSISGLRAVYSRFEEATPTAPMLRDEAGPLFLALPVADESLFDESVLVLL